MWNPFRRKGKDVLSYVNEDNGQDIATDNEGREEIKTEFIPIENSYTHGLKKTGRTILLALLVLVPIFFLTFTIPNDVLTLNKQLLIYVGAFLALAVWMFLIIRQGGMVYKKSGLEIGVLVFLATWLLASIFSPQWYKSFVSATGFISWGAMVLIFFLFVNFFKKEDIGKIIDFYVLGVFLALLFSMLNLFGVPVFKVLNIFSSSALTISQQFNTIGSMNTMAGVALLTFILLAGKFFIASIIENRNENAVQKTWLKWFWLIVKGLFVLLTVLIVLIVNWWVFYTVLAIGILLMILAPGIVENLFKFKINSSINIFGPLVVLVLAVLLIYGSRYININYPGKDKVVPEVWLTQGSSMQILKSALDKKPVFGYGPGNYYLTYDQFRPAVINNSNFWSARFYSGGSEFFNLATTGGILAVLGLITFLYYLVYQSSKILKKRGDSESGIILWMVMPAFLAAVVLFAFYSFNIVLYFTLWIFAAMIGVAVKKEGDEFKVSMHGYSLFGIITSIGLIAVIVVSLIGGYVLIQRYGSEVSFARAARLDMNKKDDVTKAIDLLTSAQNNSTGDLQYLEGLGKVLLVKIADLQKSKSTTTEATKELQNYIKAAVDVANMMTKKYGEDAMSYLDAAMIYQNLITVLNGADGVAINAITEYTKRVPNDPNGFLKLGAAYLERAERNNAALAEAKNRKLTIKNEKEVTDKILGDYKSAEDAYKAGIALKPGIAQAYYSLGIVYERQNKLGDAIKQLEILTTGSDVNNASLAFELGLLYYRNNQKDKAYVEVSRAVSIFKDYSNARWYLALMLEEQGKIPEAIAQLQEILKLDTNKNNQIVINKIASLEAGQREIPPAKVTSKQPLE
jgi:tetratricopeptide (TPR) repeat protein